jgi:hypothetical protein
MRRSVRYLASLRLLLLNSPRVNAQRLLRHAMFLAASECSRRCRYLRFSKCRYLFRYHSRGFDFALRAALSYAQTAKQYHCLGIPTHPRCLRR